MMAQHPVTRLVQPNATTRIGDLQLLYKPYISVGVCHEQSYGQYGVLTSWNIHSTVEIAEAKHFLSQSLSFGYSYIERAM